MIALDWPALTSPYVDDRAPIPDVLVRRAKPSHVQYVVINGRTVVEEGRLTTIDVSAVHRAMNRHLRRPPSSEEATAGRLAQALRPVLASLYGGWPLPSAPRLGHKASEPRGLV